MTQETIKIFIDGVYSKPPKKNYPTNRTVVYHIDVIWSLHTLDLKVYGPQNNRRFGYVLVEIDNFSNFVWTVPLKNKNPQIITDYFEMFFITPEQNQVW